MRKLKRIFFLTIYYLIASKLPNYSFPGGKFYNWFRIFCLKRILPIGKNCRIMRNVYIGDGYDVKIGNNCRINENVRLDNVEIGDHVMIARDTVVLGKMHKYASTVIPIEQQGNIPTHPTIIDDDVWIGLRVIIMPGIVIKKGTIIGAGAVVTKNTDEYSIYGGVPAKKIKKRG